jgi:methionine aminopeptidase
VHGIPNERVLKDGDIISIDCGAIVDGWHGDAAITVAVGEVLPTCRADAGHRGVALGRHRRHAARRPGH